jgi:hypothetical protein
MKQTKTGKYYKGLEVVILDPSFCLHTYNGNNFLICDQSLYKNISDDVALMGPEMYSELEKRGFIRDK